MKYTVSYKVELMAEITIDANSMEEAETKAETELNEVCYTAEYDGVSIGIDSEYWGCDNYEIELSHSQSPMG